MGMGIRNKYVHEKLSTSEVLLSAFNEVCIAFHSFVSSQSFELSDLQIITNVCQKLLACYVESQSVLENKSLENLDSSCLTREALEKIQEQLRLM